MKLYCIPNPIYVRTRRCELTHYSRRALSRWHYQVPSNSHCHTEVRRDRHVQAQHQKTFIDESSNTLHNGSVGRLREHEECSSVLAFMLNQNFTINRYVDVTDIEPGPIRNFKKCTGDVLTNIRKHVDDLCALIAVVTPEVRSSRIVSGSLTRYPITNNGLIASAKKIFSSPRFCRLIPIRFDFGRIFSLFQFGLSTSGCGGQILCQHSSRHPWIKNRGPVVIGGYHV